MQEADIINNREQDTDKDKSNNSSIRQNNDDDLELHDMTTSDQSRLLDDAQPVASNTNNNTSSSLYDTTTQSSTAASAAEQADSSSSSSRCCPWWCSLDVFRRLSRHGLGIFLICLVAIIWVSSSEFLQYVFGNENFDKPFFVTYFNTMSFALWMFGFACPGTSGFGMNPWSNKTAEEQVGTSAVVATETKASAGGRASRRATSNASAAAAAPAVSTDTPPAMRAEMRSGAAFDSEPTPPKDDEDQEKEEDQQKEEGQEIDDEDEPPPPPYTVLEIAYAAFLFCPLWFLANVLFNYSLSRTSVASNTILSSTSTIWAMIFSRLLLKENVTSRKIFALTLSFGGAVMVGFGDTSKSSSGSTAGNILAGVSAMFYAAYTTVLRYNLPDERRYPIGMCFAFVGVFNALLLWPGMILLSLLGAEPFEWPSARVAGFLVLNGLVGTNLSDILWAKSVILTSPLVATLGLSLTIPGAVIADLLLRGEWHTPLYLGGAVLVTSGFVVANLKGTDRCGGWCA